MVPGTTSANWRSPTDFRTPSTEAVGNTFANGHSSARHRLAPQNERASLVKRRDEQCREPERPTTRVLKSESMAAARLRLSFVAKGSKLNDFKIRVDGHQIRILDGEYVVDGKPTADARNLAAVIVNSLEKIRQFASRKLRTKYNSAWRDEDEPKLDESAFCVELGKPSIVIYDEIGYAVVYFKPNRIFDGHSIEVSLDSGKPKSARLIG